MQAGRRPTMNTGPWEPLGPWQGEPRSLMLAPMAGVTDLPFRLLARECGASLAITEFTNSTALTREATTSWRRMETHQMEDPFIPQIFGGDLNDMVTAAGLLEPQASIIDLNFGCPAPKVTRVCAGAALMGEPDMLLDIVRAVSDRVDIPVTAKMRLGTGQGPDTVLDLVDSLPEAGAQRICIHGRTLRQRYSGVADWDTIAEAVERSSVPVIANGDVVDAASAAACLQHTAAAGVMIGRGAIGRPQVFGEIRVGLGWMEEADLPWVAADPETWASSDENERAFRTREWCWSRYIELAEATTGLRAKWMQRHAVAFTKGLPGGRAVRAVMHDQPDEHAFAASVTKFLKGAGAE
ncbi:MAG: tRNA dihydrouridine synthase DusB [Euryarchaeota archaeon]|nr:tRNA dihydrouridine synthase DusB [Euryarchaeota archaeon]